MTNEFCSKLGCAEHGDKRVTLVLSESTYEWLKGMARRLMCDHRESLRDSKRAQEVLAAMAEQEAKGDGR